jgi:hypothetical protein
MKYLFKKAFFISFLLILVVFKAAHGSAYNHISGIEMNKELSQALPALECMMDNENDLWYDESDDSYDTGYNKSIVQNRKNNYKMSIDFYQ